MLMNFVKPNYEFWSHPHLRHFRKKVMNSDCPPFWHKMTVLSGDQDSSLDLACSIYTFNIFWTEFLLQVIYVAHCDDLFNKKYT